MPIGDPEKRRIAAQHLLYFKICRTCGSKNPISAKRCRNCHRSDLRLKKRELSK
ncbi:MAG: 50S ribosomal protein L40e [Promethearchaeati archaeon SRVP18_Atabeyarchaeia-1]